MVSLLLKVSGEPVKRSGTLKGTRSPPHAVDERGALNSITRHVLTLSYAIQLLANRSQAYVWQSERDTQLP